MQIDQEALAEAGRELIEQEILNQLYARYDEKETIVGEDVMRETERIILLNVIDNQWKDHLLSMDHLKEGIYLRGYGQKDPLIEYKKESFTLFQDMMARIEDEAIRYLYFLQAHDEHGNMLTVQSLRMANEEADERGEEIEPEVVVSPAAASITDFTRNIQRKKEKEMEALQYAGGDSTGPDKPQTVVKGQKVGRNEPCPCGSGKKYKKCHGA